MTLQIRTSPPAGGAAPALANPPPDPPTFDLRALLDRVGSAVRTGVPQQAWVVCSVVKVQRRKSGYALELGENDAGHSHTVGRLDAFLSENNLEAIRDKMGLPDFDPADLENASAVLLVALSFDVKYHLEAKVQDINPALGHSIHAKHVNRIRERLRDEDLLDRQARLPRPGDVQRLAVIYPEGAAGWADVSRELQRLATVGVIALVDVAATFEGAAAASSLRDALRKVRECEGVDAVMIIRGGGATSGFFALANEDLARDICGLPIPIITGIGHASDRTLVDELAWQATDTPSKALHFVLNLIARPAQKARADFRELIGFADRSLATHGADLQARLDQATDLSRRRLATTGAHIATALSGLRVEVARARSSLDHQSEWIEALRAELIATTPRLLQDQNDCAAIVAQSRAVAALRRLDHTRSELGRSQELGAAVKMLLDAQSTALFQLRETFAAHVARLRDSNVSAVAELESSLKALSMGDTLRRGFVVATALGGALIRSAAEARTQERLFLHFVDGTTAVRLENAQ